MPFDWTPVKDIRDRLRMSQRDFGQLLGVSQMTVYRWESGQMYPNTHNLEKLHDLAFENQIQPSFFKSPLA